MGFRPVRAVPNKGAIPDRDDIRRGRVLLARNSPWWALIHPQVGCGAFNADRHRFGHVLSLRTEIKGLSWASLALLACLLSLPVEGLGEGETAVDPPVASPRQRWLDAGLLTGGAALVGLGTLGLSPNKKNVPREGLDRNDIRFHLDRSSIRWRTHGPITASHWLLAGAQVQPSLVGLVSRGDRGLGGVELQTFTYQSEAFLIAEGLSFVLKKIVSRPRPYTYLPVNERSEKGPNWATSNQTFESFPSGHAATAWAASMVGVTTLATRRPDLASRVHFANGLVAGGLAMSASLLRVEAGMHFPTDAIGGAAIGTAAGVFVPLVHQGFRFESGQGRAFRWGLFGVASGSILAVLLTPPTSPWID